MKLDAATLTPGQVLQTDVCVVGSGAAGISVARSLAGSSLDVLVLEGGAFDASERSQELYDGEMATTYRAGSQREDYDRTYVSRSRLRFFGGTTNHWNGWCRALEPLDFTRRDWVPRSGWPISRTDLDPWYDKARAVVEIPAFERDHGYGRKEGRRMVCLADSEQIVTRLFHWSPPTRFGTKYRMDLVRAPNVRLLLEANVLRLTATPEANRVTAAQVQLEDGPAITVQARAFVLACGGIENARLLLLSDEENPAGLGNDKDQVGRHFMEHPHVPRIGQVLVADSLGIKGLTDLYFRARTDKQVDGRTMGVMCTSEAVQREEKLLNWCVQLRDYKDSKLNRFGEALAPAQAGVRDLGREPDKMEPYAGRLFVRGEQVPNPDSRVTLTDETDRLGLRKVRLDWRLGEQDRQSIRRSMEIFAAEFGRSGIGRVRIKMDSDGEWPPTRGGDHHLGTTRMAADPSHGVVDADCRVHGVDNLFMAGSSVFATSGFANPTFTITALALRLADHLRGELTP